MFVNDELQYDEYEDAQDGGFGLSLKKAVRAVAKPVKAVAKPVVNVVKKAPVIKPALKITKKVTSPLVRTVAAPFGGRAGQGGGETYVDASGSARPMPDAGRGIRQVGKSLGKTKGMIARVSETNPELAAKMGANVPSIMRANGAVTPAPVPVQTESGEVFYQEPTASEAVADSLSAGASTMPGMPNINMPSLPGIMPQMRMPTNRLMEKFQGRTGMQIMPTMPTFTQRPAPVAAPVMAPAPVPMVAPQYPQYQEPVAYQEPQYYEQAPQEYYEQPQQQMVQEAEFEPVEMSDEEMYYDETGEEMPQDEKGFWDKVKDSLAGGNSMSGLGAVELDHVTGEPIQTAVASSSGSFADEYAKGADSFAKVVGQTKAIGSATRKVKRSITGEKAAAPVAQAEKTSGGVPPALIYGAGAVGVAGLVFLLIKMRNARQSAA